MEENNVGRRIGEMAAALTEGLKSAKGLNGKPIGRVEPECTCGPSAPYDHHEHSCPQEEGNRSQRVWTDWLASAGYGTDFAFSTNPPCTLDDLADAYVRVTGEEDREAWAWAIGENWASLPDARRP